MAREKFARAQFEKYVLPQLMEKHGRDVELINRRIKNSYDITDNGRPIEFEVAMSGDGQETLTEEAIEKMVTAELKQYLQPKSAKRILSPTSGTQMKSFSPSHFRGAPRHFKNDESGRDAAFRWGCFGLAAFGGNERAKEYLDAEGIQIKSANEGTNSAGGYLVPTELSNDLIQLVNSYGVFRRYSGVREMRSDVLNIPRRQGGLTASFVAEGAAGTASTKAWDNVGLVAKKIMVLARMSSELVEDAVIDIGSDLAGECALAFALKEDQCGFIGDATSTYGGITGVCPALLNKWTSTSTSSAGVVIAAGNAMSEVTMTNLTDTMALLPAYARRNAKWYCSSFAKDSIFMRLALAAGGVTLGDVVRGTTPAFAGYEIVLTEVMPASDVNSQIVAVFGDLSLASKFGDRRQITIAMATSGSVDGSELFTTDSIALRATERFDVVVHDVGDGSSVAGPVVGLRAASA